MSPYRRPSISKDSAELDHELELLDSCGNGSQLNKLCSFSSSSPSSFFNSDSTSTTWSALNQMRSRVKHFSGQRLKIFRKITLRIWLLILLFNICITAIITTTARTSSNKQIDLASSRPDDIPVSYVSLATKKDAPFYEGCQVPDSSQPRADAAFVVLARNSELKDVLKSMKSLERHFNQWYSYPWVFLNDEPFDEEFKTTVKEFTKGGVEFGLVPKQDWDFPEDLDPKLFYESIESQGDRGIMYGNMASYHKMCRFYSGHFYKHELVKKRKWYWRVEPNVEFFCDITYDPFIEMEKHNKKYGFTVLIPELYYTVPGLFRETKDYIRKSGIKVGSLFQLFIKDGRYSKGKHEQEYDGLSDKKDILEKIEKNVITEKFLQLKDKTDKQVSELNQDIVDHFFSKVDSKPPLYEDRIDYEEYNLCHFWSNFEIARTDLFTNPVYEGYFKHLEESGGFYKERWGDAPVHSLGVGMMLDTEEIHYFRDIGYKHSSLQHCPRNHENQLPYTPSKNYTRKMSPREESYWLKFDKVGTAGVGCRCRCPWTLMDVEDAKELCMKRWREVTRDNYKPRIPLDIDHWEREISTRIDKAISTGAELGEGSVLKKYNLDREDTT